MTLAGRFLTYFAATGMILLAGWVIPSPSAAAASDRVAASNREAELDPAPVVISGPQAAHSYRFALDLPRGTHLRALGPGSTGQILVENSAGKLLGAYDAPWAADASGRPLSTSYRIEGRSLIQTVAFDARTRFPVTIDPIYSAIVPRSTGIHSPGVQSMTPLVISGRPSEVTVPANYVYDPSLGSRHDYCTFAPDEFPAPGAPNADFRGPCARHDLCYSSTTSHSTCDNALLRDMDQNCEHYYGVFSLLRAACKATAAIYWAAVTVT